MFSIVRFQLNIWDVGGQKSLRSYWRNYFESTDGLVWVVDSADRRRIEDCRKELHVLLQEEVASLLSPSNHIQTDPYSPWQRLAGATLLVFANKQDIEGSMTSDEIKDALDLDKITSHHWLIVSCSAIQGDNLLKGIDWLVGDIGARVFTTD